MSTLLKNRRGTSLIEVLVTLVIIAVGILSVSRMFSGGYVVLRRGENYTFASRLAEKEFERLRARSDTMPSGLTTVTGINTVPGPPLNTDNIYNIRKVIGETVKIPGPQLSEGVKGTITGSIYTVAFSPISGIDAVYSASMQRRRFDSEDVDIQPWTFLSITQYAIDYDNAMICFRAKSQDADYSLSYSYWTVDNSKRRRLVTVTSVNVHVPAGAGWLPIPDANGNPVSDVANFSYIDGRSDKVSRAFLDVTGTPGWSTSDPYEYKVLDPLTGRLAFNPVGYAYKENTPRGVEDLTARIDYTVYDWGIISETLQVPNQAPFRVRTTLRRIKQLGVTMADDGTLYDGIAPGAGPVGQTDMLIVDEDTGEVIPATGGVLVNYQAGILDFPDNGNVVPVGGSPINISGRSLRVYYRAEDDWRVMPQKAYESYISQDNHGLSFREFFNPDGTADIYLSEMDASKSFSVDYVWDDNGTDRTVVGEVHRADDGVQQFPAGFNAHFVLNHPPVAIRAVRGVSLKVRVLWSEGSRVDQNNNIVNRWQHYDLDGELQRTVSAQ
ncbi:MAG: prepilin-type N-terminal cleavage/methylation domain-containing protein [Armatimonadetes bacterium]|nr:prepilin-type N-terminal cleavage/methylation domain-containing protein [Armatimonadota bacterium]